MPEFIHQISKGSRYNQIYIPKEMEEMFEIGDTIKVILLKKKTFIYYSKNLKLGEFKKNLIKKVFQLLASFPEIKQVFIVGSFLVKKTDYKDIDILIVYNKKINEEKIQDFLTEKITLNFHILAIEEKSFNSLVKICPLTRSTLYYFVSNRKFVLPEESIFDKNHINFLLMMPYDLLKINAGSRTFYDNIRRLTTIQRFLEKKPLNPEEIDAELEKNLGNFLFSLIKNNESIDEKIIKKLRNLIKLKLQTISKLIKWEKQN